MRKAFLISIMLFSFVAMINGQAVPSSRLGWDQDALTLADAQGYTYTYYADGAATGVTFTSVVCTGTVAPFQCSAPFPAFTPGNHSVQLTARNVAGESDKSSPFTFVFVVTPSVPSGLRIINK